LCKVLILEDEEYTRRYLEKIVSEIPLITQIIAAASGSEAISLVKQHRPDIIMVDVELQQDELNGIEIAKIICKIKSDVHFIFVTGYSKYAIDSFSVNPHDYVLKPVKKEKIIETLYVLIGKLKTNSEETHKPTKIIVKEKAVTFFISLDDILFLERLESKTKIHTDQRVFEISPKLTEIAYSLTPNFLRVHQSCIVNEDKISKIRELTNRTYEVEFQGYKQKAIISRYKYQEFKEKFTPSY